MKFFDELSKYNIAVKKAKHKYKLAEATITANGFIEDKVCMDWSRQAVFEDSGITTRDCDGISFVGPNHCEHFSFTYPCKNTDCKIYAMNKLYFDSEKELDAARAARRNFIFNRLFRCNLK